MQDEIINLTRKVVQDNESSRIIGNILREIVQKCLIYQEQTTIVSIHNLVINLELITFHNHRHLQW